MTRRTLLFLGAVATGLLFRFALIFRYRFDSDEPQHMHVAWGWAHGLVQYRDVFDNHMPLFHLLSAPLFLASGDDPRLLFAARMLMVPLFAVSLILVWAIARRLFDETAAWWATALVAFFPPYFLGSLEYRTDDLWVVCWLAAVVVAISDLSPLPRSAFTGFFLGLAFAVSMKSVLFAIALGGSALITLLLTRRDGERLPPAQVMRNAAAAAGCALVPPVLVAGGFAAAGVWRPFVYGVFEHNIFPFEHRWRVLWLVLLYPGARAIALAIARSGGDAPLVRKRLFVFLTFAIYTVVLAAFWPMTNAETFLPVYPLVVLLVAPLTIRSRTAIPALCVALEIAALLATAKPWRNNARHQIELVTEIVGLTHPHEPVMDLKGESIFRSRPYYHGIEAITNVKLRLGRMQDGIAGALIRTGTAVVVGGEALPPDALHFVRANYLRWGLVRVAGVRVRPAAAHQSQAFAVAIPGDYVVWDGSGVVRAAIDGVEVGRGIRLTGGVHTLVMPAAVTRPIVVWAGVLRWRRDPDVIDVDPAAAHPRS